MMFLLKYIRIEHKTDPQDFIQYMYSSEGWGLTMPNLIISVTGGAQNFVVPASMKKAFKEGLYKAAASTGAWIISGGTNTGVMKLVGEAIADEFYIGGPHKRNLTILGVVTWGIVDIKEELKAKHYQKSDLKPVITQADVVSNTSKEKKGESSLDPVCIQL